MSGWICSYRRIWDLFAGNALRVGVWTWMLHKAAWRDTRFKNAGKLITLERGQLCMAQRQVEAETGISRQQLRTFLAELEAEGAITQDTTHGRTVVTICKYEKYQDVKEGESPTGNPRATQEQPTKEQINNNNNIPVGADASAPPPDPVKIIFDQGISLLGRSGTPDRQARGLLGRWRRDYGDAALIAALGSCQREGAIDPVAFITGCLKAKAKARHVHDPSSKTLNAGAFGLIREYC